LSDKGIFQATGEGNIAESGQKDRSKERKECGGCAGKGHNEVLNDGFVESKKKKRRRRKYRRNRTSRTSLGLEKKISRCVGG